jgi:hypothetical protein
MTTINDIKIQMLEHAGYKVKIMETERLRGDITFGLPPGRPMDVYPLEYFPGVPEEWCKEVGSYVIPINSEKAMWFDFTMNQHETTGVITGIKCLNPITGLKIENLKLEQYRDQCPTHKIPFGHDRYCEKCKYNWPGQNYLSYPNTLWIDGFRQPDGTVRQFFFTDEEMRDVASAVIGKQNTTISFGFAFFRNKRVVTREPQLTRGAAPYFGIPDFDYTPHWFQPTITYYGNQTTNISLDDGIKKSISEPVNQVFCCSATSEVGASFAAPVTRSFRNTTNKEVAVGAGAKINQKLLIDTLPLSEWIKEPQALIRLYFVFNEQLNTIIRNGGIKIPEKKENGYLQEIKIG